MYRQKMDEPSEERGCIKQSAVNARGGRSGPILTDAFQENGEQRREWPDTIREQRWNAASLCEGDARFDVQLLNSLSRKRDWKHARKKVRRKTARKKKKMKGKIRER